MTKNRLIFSEIESLEPGDIFDSRKELNKPQTQGTRERAMSKILDNLKEPD